jgi:hypothetical protein
LVDNAREPLSCEDGPNGSHAGDLEVVERVLVGAPLGRRQGSAFLMSLPVVIWFVRHNSGVGCKFQSGSNREGCRRGGSLSTWLSEARSIQQQAE